MIGHATHYRLWEVQPREPVHGIRHVVRLATPAFASRTHGIRTIVFSSESAARAYAADCPKHWTIECRVWGAAILAEGLALGNVEAPEGPAILSRAEVAR